MTAWRWLAVGLTAAAMMTISAVYVARARDRATPVRVVEPAPGALLYRAANGRVTIVGGEATPLVCDRFAARGGTALCLVAAPPIATAIVLDRRLREVRRISVPGVPSRATVSPSGRLVGWTTFVTGHSYAGGSFSTATGIFDVRTGKLISDIENLQVYAAGARLRAADLNIWGVTFAADDQRFHATVATGGRTHLVTADIASWRAEVVRSDVECPSLSPDGTRIAYKKRTGSGWRLSVLSLASPVETPLAETASVDDQALWLDDRTVAYGRAGGVWSVPADGTGTPHLLIPHASSPAVW